MSNTNDFIIENGTLKKYASKTTEPKAIFPEEVHTIGANAFKNCENLIHISGTENITHIQRSAFELCSRLEGDLYLTNVTEIEYFAFACCTGKLNIHFSNSLVALGRFVFFGCNNTTIYAPAGSYAETYANENNLPFVAE